MTVYEPVPTFESCPSPPLYAEEDTLPQIPAASSSILDYFRRKAIHSATGMTVSRPGRWRKRILAYRASLVILSLIILILILGIFYLLLVMLVLRRLQPIIPNNDVQQLQKSWHAAADSLPLLGEYGYHLTDDIDPVLCHSHNDYSHRIPLFDALSVGCISVEADLWLPSEDFLNAHPEVSKQDLLVGHNRGSLRSDRTLKTLYTHLLLSILDYQNVFHTKPGHDEHPRIGIFSKDPSQPLVLLLDIKEGPSEIFKRIQVHLDAFRDSPYLTYWNDTLQQRIDRPLTVVLTGDADFAEITDEKMNYFRDVFYDAPLHDLFPDSTQPQSSPYNISNSYFASTSLKKHIGNPRWLGSQSGFSPRQREDISKQINDAMNLGLVSRYWGTPNWPVSTRSYVWSRLVDYGVGILNVDDLGVAARWDWSNSLLSYCGLLRVVGFKDVCR